MPKRLIPLAISALSLATSLLQAAPAGYLFATFKGEQTPLTEQIYFAISKDGRNWQALNEGNPTLVSEQGEKGLRDPYLLRSHDGSKFYMIATDLSINLKPDWSRAVRAGSRNIVVFESTDLVNWSEPRLIPVAPQDAGCTWAPEAIYDDVHGDYLVFWASTTARDDFAKHRIWAARTEDFVTFGEPFIFIEKPTTVIDTTIIHDGHAYYRFTKDEKYKAITMETAAHLAGPWSDIPHFSLAHLRGFEGPEAYQIEPPSDGKPARWTLILDQYSTGAGYQPYVTEDLSSGDFQPAEDFTFPFHFRHGSVIPLNIEEFERLEKKWGESE